MRKFSKKTVALMVSIALLLCVSIGTTLAYLIDVTGEVENTFTPSSVTTQVVETFDGTTKSNVSIKNTGNTDASIRAAVVVTWQDSAGNVYGQEPVAGTDYTISINTSAQTDPVGQWELKSDGFYYWSNSVASGANTGILVTSCTMIGTAPEGYTLCVEILGSGIQAEGISGTHPWGN